jgi:hypothetical protein
LAVLFSYNLYWQNRPLKNTYYKNNGIYNKVSRVKLKTKTFTVKPDIIANYVNDIVFADVDFEDFITLQSRIRSERGFIRSIDNNQVIKVYPIDGILTC